MTRSLTKRDKLLLHGFITVFGYVDDWSINEIELAESVLFYKRQTFHSSLSYFYVRRVFRRMQFVQGVRILLSN